MLGDALAQTKVEKKEKLDRKRFFATGAYAGLIVGPIGHGWYSGLDSFVLRYFRPATFAFVASKVGGSETLRVSHFIHPWVLTGAWRRTRCCCSGCHDVMIQRLCSCEFICPQSIDY